MFPAIIGLVLNRTLDKVIASTVAGGAVGAIAQTVASTQSPDVLLSPLVREFLLAVAPTLASYPNFVGVTSALIAGVLSGAVVGVTGYYKKEKAEKLVGLKTK